METLRKTVNGTTVAELFQKAAAIYPVKSSFDAGEYAEKRAENYNKKPGHLLGYECKKCLNRGNIMIAKDGMNYIRPCKCMKARESIARLEKSGLKDMVREMRFDAYETLEPWQKTAKEMAQRYAENPEGRWFVASGNAGSGKTHLCVAICREFMLRGYETHYMLWRDEIVKIKAVSNSEDEYQRMMQPLKDVSVLYIDDFLKCGSNSAPTTPDVGVAFELLNARYINRKLITVISTERTLDYMINLDEALGSRIYERSKGFLLKLEGKEKNWRLRA